MPELTVFVSNSPFLTVIRPGSGIQASNRDINVLDGKIYGQCQYFSCSLMRVPLSKCVKDGPAILSRI